MQLSSASDTHYRLTASARRRTLPAAARLHAVAVAGGASSPHHQPQQAGPWTAHIARVATPEVLSVCLNAFGAHACSPGRLTGVQFSLQETTIRNTGQDGEHSSGQDAVQQLYDGSRHKPAAVADGFQPITAIWARNAAAFGDQVALLEPHRSPVVSVTYRELSESITDYAAGLRAHGLQQGDRVCLFAESSSRWIVADQAILMNGAADAVRGSSSPVDELGYILNHSGSSGLVLQDRAALLKLLPAVKEAVAAGQAIKFVAVLWDDQPTAAAAAGPTDSSSSSSSGNAGSSNGHQAGTNNGDLETAAGAAAAGPEAELEALGVAVLSYQGVLSAGQQVRAAGPFVPAACGRSDLATLVYTSGTTGHPKGVMLSHGNLAYQVDHLDYFLPVSAGDSTLSLLPPWHIYQRSVAYYLFSRGAREVFTSLRHFREDLVRHPPDHFVCVPLVLDTLYNKVMSKLKSEATGLKGSLVSALLSASTTYIQARRVVTGHSLLHAAAPPSAGQRLVAAVSMALTAPLYALAQKLVFGKVRAALGIRKTVISGGGSLAGHLDLFFEALGLTVLNGWGLTETSPVLACRRPSANVRGSVGLPTPGTQVVVVDPTTHSRLPDGQQGLLLAAGPGVMAGYWRDAGATRKAFVDGWFNTGDLGWRAPAGVPGSSMGGHIVLTGRAKDTLVLLSGKNIEPQPIEDALCRSPFIKHVVLLGQDKRELGALVFPDEEHLAATGADAGVDAGAAPSSSSKGLESLLLREVCALNKARPDYHPEDHIGHIQVVRSPLSVEAGTLTRTMKPRRPAIRSVYSQEVEQLMVRLRG